MGVDFSWYAIGFGTEEENLKKVISEFGFEERFFLLGKKQIRTHISKLRYICSTFKA